VKGKLTKIILYSILGLTVLCIGIIGYLALSNWNLPTHSQVVDRLSDLEKARLAEAIHLRQTLGDQVWPGWGDADIPFIIYNEGFAFLLGYPEPPDGWVKVPQNEARGGPWEAVPGDTFNGQVYYRQELLDPKITPENFTVLVGDRWSATLSTKEYSLVSFVSGFRTQLPLVIRSIFPYRWMWWQLVGETENYLGALEHEAFHAYQGTTVPQRLAESEKTMVVDELYPWDDEALEDAWQVELDYLLAAVKADTDQAAVESVRSFLASREMRRANGLTPAMVDFERQREWLEGLAKYVEVEIGLAAQDAADYAPIDAIQSDPDFNGYQTRHRYRQGQVGEVNRLSGRGGDTRFYYSGMAQAMLLDRLMPGWKEQAFEPEVMLEDLLRQAVE
jgi:hypothetical protein